MSTEVISSYNFQIEAIFREDSLSFTLSVIIVFEHLYVRETAGSTFYLSLAYIRLQIEKYYKVGFEVLRH